MSTVAADALDLFVDFNEWWADRIGVRAEFATIEGLLAEVVVDDDARERCRARLVAPLGEQLAAMSMRVLLQEFHAHRRAAELPLDPSSDEALRGFTAELTEQARVDLLDRYPVMDARARRLIEVRTAAVIEVLERLRADRPVLAAAGIVDESIDVALLRPSGGDAHNGGRTVLAVEFADGTTVMYKPRSMSTDRFARQILAAVAPYVEHDLECCIPDSFDRGAYGWQCFVAAGPSQTTAEADAYFYRYGALCAVLGAIGTTDLHNENVIACGGVPVIIDTETILRMGTGTPTATLLETMLTTAGFSAAAASLVPTRTSGSPVDAVLAGIGVVEHQQMSRTYPRLVDAGTDAMRLERSPIDLAPTEENIPRVGERRLAATDHLDRIAAGFRDAMRAVRSGAVTSALHSAEPCVVRYVLRATFVYAQFLDASFHPRFADDQGHLDGLVARLGLRPVDASAQQAIARHERAALFDGDVPLFDGWSDECVIRCGDDVVAAAMPDSPIDHALRGVELAAERTDEYHLAMLEACLAETGGDDADLLTGSVFGPLVRPTEVGEVATRAAEFLAATAVRHAGDEGEQFGWILATGDGETTLSVGQGMGFHEAGGIAAFLQRAHARGIAPAEDAEGAVRGLRALVEAGKPAREGEPHPLLARPSSAFGGAASLLMSIPDVSDHWFDLCFARPTADGQAAEAQAPDLVVGPAGLAMIAAADPDVRRRMGDVRWAALVEQVHSTVDTGWTGDRVWSDLAHGAVGLHWANVRVARAAADAASAAESATWIGRHLREHPLPTAAGWCNGAAGLLLVAAEAAAATGSEQLLDAVSSPALRRRCWSVLDGEGPIDVSVCHGTSGAVQSLAAAGLLVGDPTLLAEAVDLHEATLRAVATRGARTGSRRYVAVAGYMLGWSGYADTDLLVASLLDGDRAVTVPAALVPFGHAVTSSEMSTSHRRHHGTECMLLHR